MQQQVTKPLCINCKHNRVSKCGHEEEIKEFPKVVECTHYGFTPAFIYRLDGLYAKLHTQK